jgi:hypothetical protein
MLSKTQVIKEKEPIRKCCPSGTWADPFAIMALFYLFSIPIMMQPTIQL